MAVRASDRVTLAVLTSPTYVRQYYLKQASTLNPPASPTTNPPTGTWSTVEPSYTAGSTDTLYTVMLTAYGTAYFEYGPVQKSSAFEAAKQAYNAAQAAAAAANTALDTANDKNKVIFSTAAATGTEYSEGDIWFRKSGSTIIGQWEFAGGAWATRTLTNAVISTLDAAKITTGSLNAARLAAGSISTQKLLITNLDNLMEDSSFEYGGGWALTAPAVIGTTTPRTGAKSLSIPTSAAARVAATAVSAMAVEEGEQYRLSAWVRLVSGTAASNGVTLRMRTGATEATTTSVSADIVVTSNDVASEYERVFGEWTVPAGAKFARLEIVIRDATAGKTYLVDDVALYRLQDGELIVDGSIIAAKIGAEQIVGEHIQGSVIDTEHLRAGAVTTEVLAAGSVTADILAAGSVETNHLTAGSVQTNHLSPAVGDELYLGANSTIQLVVGQIEDVSTTLDETNSSLSSMQTIYSFDADRALISSPDSSFATAIRNDRIEMLENDNVVSYWNSGQLWVGQFIGEKVTLGRHQLEQFSANDTVVRAL